MNQSTLVGIVFVVSTTHLAWLESQTPQSESSSSVPVEVAILGVHRAKDSEEGTPKSGASAGLLSGDRAPIRQVLKRLQTFQPTMLAVEAAFDNSLYAERYRRFLAGDQRLIDLFSNLAEQLAFTLGKKLGHEKVYPIDFKMELNEARMHELLRSSPQSQAIYQEMMDYGNQMAAKHHELSTEGSLLDLLIHLNGEEAISQNQSFYTDFILRMGEGKNYGGAEVVASWYERNLKIFHNLHRITLGQQDERVLIFIDHAHIKYLRDLIRESSHFKFVDIVPILKKE